MTLASAQRRLNLSEEEIMTQALRASLVNQPLAGWDKKMKAIEDAKFSSLVGRRNTSCNSNAVQIITIHNFGDDDGGGKKSSPTLLYQPCSVFWTRHVHNEAPGTALVH